MLDAQGMQIPYDDQPIAAIELIDGYKSDHRRQYPDNTQRVLSNSTARSSRVLGQTGVVKFGDAMFLRQFLMDLFNETFFSYPVETVGESYIKLMNAYLGPNGIGKEHIMALHELGYIPLEWRNMPEGTFVPLGIPLYLTENTNDDFGWIVNYLETLEQDCMWLPTTSATTASRFRHILEEWVAKTGSDPGFIGFQGHDFSMRGMHNPWSAMASGLGHCLFFEGSDTVPVMRAARYYYGGFPEDYFIAGSIGATEHSVVCANGFGQEDKTIRRLATSVYPSGPFSYVSDTWDLWELLTVTLPSLKDVIMERDGKMVIRPDSGDPIKIVCGDPDAEPGSPSYKGVIQLLWENFGGTYTSTGHKLLDSHIGCIYGDGISEERMVGIVSILAQKGFATQNMVFGLGSYTYTYVTRDTYGIAMKATWCLVDDVAYDLHKDPTTDDGGKKSAKGRLAVIPNADGHLELIQQASPAQEAMSVLQPTWRDGDFLVTESYDVIRNRARVQAGFAIPANA